FPDRGPVGGVGGGHRQAYDASGRELLTALRTALAAAPPTRVEITVNAAASLADGRPAVRLTVATPDTADGPAVWERPL
ncbi:histidine kinase, partial [Streptomyces sp. NPDC002446]